MKKLIAIAVVIIMAVSAFAAVAQAADTLEYVHFVAGGNDPYANFTFANGAKIDPDTVKWAAIKYRTITEVDNTGVQLKGQLYVNPAAEPFIPIEYKHTQKWEVAVIDLTSVSSKTTLSSIWDSSHYTGTTAIRFDPMEPDRDAEDQNNEHNVAEVEADSAIDVAWIAFFENEADAKAFDGSQNTYACILDAAALSAPSGGNNIRTSEIAEEEAKAEDPNQGGDDEPANPSTSDASVVAIASVACIALAGIVVAAKGKARR